MSASYLSVQHAARRLGVSPVTIRRWTATGFLPCTRTAGGHRRIAVDDIEELARAIGGSSQLAARRARERELDTIVETSIAVASEDDLQPLLAEIARRVTHLLDCDFCAVSSYDRDSRLVRTLAEYDATGKRLPDTETYDVRKYPLTRKVLEEHVHAVVNVDDPRADAAEVAELRAGGDRSLLMVPLVFRGEAIGLLEASDARRARSYSRQELRLCEAVAGQAAVALHSAWLRAESRTDRDDLEGLCEALRRIAPLLAEALAAPDERALLERLAQTVCDVTGAISCVVAADHLTAGALSASELPSGFASTSMTDPGHSSAPQLADLDAHIVVGRDAAAGVTITVTLARPAAGGVVELLDLLATLAGARSHMAQDRPPAAFDAETQAMEHEVLDGPHA